jgi:hypothetical protein
MAKNRDDGLAVGDDSFLDTIANLVGVLIILVVIMGTKTQQAAKEYGEKQRREAAAQIEKPATEMVSIRKSVAEQEQRLARHELELDYRKQERLALLRKIGELEEELKKKLDESSEDVRERVENESEIAKLTKQLEDLKNAQSHGEEEEEAPIALQHLPTPMAKTVFGQEMHLRMANGRVSVIPWDRLVEQLKQTAPLAARRGMNRDVIEDSLGPMEGYMMKFRLVNSKGMVQAGGRVGMGSIVELERFELEVVEPNIGESIQEALSPGSRLRIELAGRQPRETVITVWVYPDSFEEFRLLKEALFEEGFLTAARPLPDGILIGASPRGSRSTAQ